MYNIYIPELFIVIMVRTIGISEKFFLEMRALAAAQSEWAASIQKFAVSLQLPIIPQVVLGEGKPPARYHYNHNEHTMTEFQDFRDLATDCSEIKVVDIFDYPRAHEVAHAYQNLARERPKWVSAWNLLRAYFSGKKDIKRTDLPEDYCRRFREMFNGGVSKELDRDDIYWGLVDFKEGDGINAPAYLILDELCARMMLTPVVQDTIGELKSFLEGSARIAFPDVERQRKFMSYFDAGYELMGLTLGFFDKPSQLEECARFIGKNTQFVELGRGGEPEKLEVSFDRFNQAVSTICGGNREDCKRKFEERQTRLYGDYEKVRQLVSQRLQQKLT